MFELSEAIVVILSTRHGIDSFNDALSDAELPYRLFRVADGFDHRKDLNCHSTSQDQVRLNPGFDRRHEHNVADDVRSSVSLGSAETPVRHYHPDEGYPLPGPFTCEDSST